MWAEGGIATEGGIVTEPLLGGMCVPYVTALTLQAEQQHALPLHEVAKSMIKLLDMLVSSNTAGTQIVKSFIRYDLCRRECVRFVGMVGNLEQLWCRVSRHGESQLATRPCQARLEHRHEPEGTIRCGLTQPCVCRQTLNSSSTTCWFSARSWLDLCWSEQWSPRKSLHHACVGRDTGF